MKRARHVVFIGGTSEPGGLHVQTAEVAAACAAAGVRTSVLCVSVDYFSALIKDRNVGLVVVPQEALDADWGKAVGTRLKRMRATDAVLCHGRFGETPTAGLLAVRAACRTIYTIDHSPMEREPPRWPFGLMHRLAMRLLVRRSIVVSEEIERQACVDLRIGADRVVVCRNWCDPEFQPAATAAQRRAARTALGLPVEGTVLGFHGRLAPEKRLDVLLSAYALLDDDKRANAPLVLIGEGWKRSELQDLVRTLGIEANVVFAGWRSDVARAVAAIDIYVLPSLVEGFPLALMEAMASGAYCLAHPMSSTIDLLGSDGSRGVLWPLCTPVLMKGALDAALSVSPKQRKAAGARAADWIRANHSRNARLPPVLHALGIAATVCDAAVPGGRRLEFSKQ
jgi:glycosyltransferase involved in cell wall biosynthesis